MTADKRFHRRVRARAARTGESYAAAHRRLSSREDRAMAKKTKTNPIDNGLAECVVAFVRERHNLVIGTSGAATLAAARRGSRPAETIGDPLTVTGADPATGAVRVEVIDHLELSAYVDEKVQQANLTDDAKAALARARDRAAAAGHTYIGQEHVLAAIVEAQPALDLFAACGVDAKSVLDKLGRYLQPHGDTPAATPCWTPRAIRALNLAQAETAKHGRDLADVRYLVLGVVADGEGLGAAALGAVGVGLETIRTAL